MNKEIEKIGQGHSMDADAILTGYNRMRVGLVLILQKFGPQKFTREEALAIIDAGTRYPVRLHMGDATLEMSVETNEEHGRTQ